MMASMDSQFIANLISGISALATVVAAIYTRRQAIGSKEAKAKAGEAHKAALDMRDAAQRSAKAAEEQANQAELARKAAEERSRQAEELLEQMSDIASSLWRPELELTHEGDNWFKLRNVTNAPIKILKVANANRFKMCHCPSIPGVLRPGEEVRVTLSHMANVTNLELQIDGRDDIVYVPIRYSNQ